MNRKAKLAIAGAAAGVLSVFGFAAPASAQTVYSGCDVTTPAPHKVNNTVTTTWVLTCNNNNVGDSAFVELWRHNGDGSYTGYPTELSKGSHFTQYAIPTTPHTCSNSSNYVWHAEFFGDLQLPDGSDPPFNPVNSNDVTLACH